MRPRPPRILLAALVAIATLAMASPSAHAGDRVVVVGPITSLLEVRLAAELRIQGFDVRPERGAVADLEAACARHRARVATRPLPEVPAVEVLILDEAGAEPLLSERVQGSEAPVLAVRAAELVRVALLGEIARRREPPAPRTIALGAGASALLSPGGLGLVPAGHLELALWPDDRWAAEAHLLAPLAASQVSNELGEVDAGPWLALVGARRRLAGLRARLGVDLGAGLGLALVTAQGVAGTPRERLDDTAILGVLWLRGGLELRLLRELGLRLDALLGATAPAAIIRFDGVESARWGQPFVALSGRVIIGL